MTSYHRWTAWNYPLKSRVVDQNRTNRKRDKEPGKTSRETQLLVANAAEIQTDEIDKYTSGKTLLCLHVNQSTAETWEKFNDSMNFLVLFFCKKTPWSCDESFQGRTFSLFTQFMKKTPPKRWTNNIKRLDVDFDSLVLFSSFARTWESSFLDKITCFSCCSSIERSRSGRFDASEENTSQLVDRRRQTA